MCSQMSLCIIVCHTMILEAATVIAVMGVRTAIITFPITVASSRERSLGIVAIAETAEDNNATLFWAAVI